MGIKNWFKKKEMPYKLKIICRHPPDCARTSLENYPMKMGFKKVIEKGRLENDRVYFVVGFERDEDRKKWIMRKAAAIERDLKLALAVSISSLKRLPSKRIKKLTAVLEEFYNDVSEKQDYVAVEVL